MTCIIDQVSTNQISETRKQPLTKSRHIQTVLLDDFNTLEMKYNSILKDYEMLKNSVENQSEKNTQPCTKFATVRFKVEESANFTHSQVVQAKPNISKLLLQPSHERLSEQAAIMTTKQADPSQAVLKDDIFQKVILSPKTRDRFTTFYKFAPNVLEMFVINQEEKKVQREINNQPGNRELKEKKPTNTFRSSESVINRPESKMKRVSQSQKFYSYSGSVKNKDDQDNIERECSLPKKLQLVKCSKIASQEEIKQYLVDMEYWKAHYQQDDDGIKQMLDELGQLKQKTKWYLNPILLGLICLFLTIFIKMIPEK